MCDDIATTDEHVPPKCLFPDGYRKNLITVRSCKKHNNDKARDDEFLRTLLVYNDDANKFGNDLFFGKTLRAVSRKPIAYANFFKPQLQINSPTGIVHKIDRNRFDQCVEHIVKGIYFHHYNKKIFSHLFVASPRFNSRTRKGNPYVKSEIIDFCNRVKSILQYEPIYGDNREIFQYRILSTKDGILFAAQFYESTEIFVSGSV